MDVSRPITPLLDVMPRTHYVKAILQPRWTLLSVLNGKKGAGSKTMNLHVSSMLVAGTYSGAPLVGQTIHAPGTQILGILVRKSAPDAMAITALMVTYPA